MARDPALTAACCLTLALGIGANSAIFSVINAVLLRPLPVRDPSGLVTVAMTNAKFNETGAPPGFASYAAWRRNSRSFESIAAANSDVAALSQGPSTQPVKFWRVSASFLPVLGVSPILGRNFTEQEDSPGSAKVALLSNHLWRTFFAADPRVLGAMVHLDDVAYTVVGVLPPGFHVDGRPADVYAPIAMSADTRAWLAVDIYGRLRPGITPEQATAELLALSKREAGSPFQWKPRVWILRDFQVRDVRLSLWVLLGAAGLVLLIACANTASLLLARATARSQEISIRGALGAGRTRLIRQLLTESSIVAFLGGALGVGIAALCVRLVPYLQHERLPGLFEQSSIDASVLLFTLGASIATGLLFGLAPALATVVGNPFEALRSGRGLSGGMRRNGGFRALVVAETALALVLAIGATLLIRTFFYLRDVAPGFRVDGLMVASVNSDRGKFSTPEQCIAYYRELAAAVARIPGVKAASFAQNIPLTGELAAYTTEIEGHHFGRPQDYPVLWVRAVDTEFFRTMQVPLTRGRHFNEGDHRSAARVVIVNEAFVRKFWPGTDPIGKRLGEPGREMRVVGVIADVRSQDSTKDAAAEVYLPYLQNPTARVTLAIRTDPNVYRKPLFLEQPLRKVIAAVDARQAVTKVAEMQQLISGRVAPKRLSAQLIAAFAGLAVALAVVGIYGVLSFTVARRTHEIGLRMALGAERASLVGMVVGQSSRLALVGVALGIASALGLTRFLRSLVYGVSPADPWVYAIAVAATIALSIAAAMVPAWRATRVDPIVALREE